MASCASDYSRLRAGILGLLGITLANIRKPLMSEVSLLVVLAVVIIAGGYLLGYRSGQHRARRDSRNDQNSPKR